MQFGTFATRPEAKAWHDREAAKYRGSRFSKSLGQVPWGQVVEDFLHFHETQVSENTVDTGRFAIRLLPLR